MLAVVMILMPMVVSAQERGLGNEDTSSSVDAAGALQKHVSLLRNRKVLLEKRLASLPLDSQDFKLTSDWLSELTELIEQLKQNGSAAMANQINLIGGSAITLTNPSTSGTSLDSNSQVFTKPVFKLSRPTGGKTNEVTELTLAWTEDHPCPAPKCDPITRNYAITKFVIEIASDQKRFSNKRFAQPIFAKEVISDGSSAQAIKVPKETLQSGQKYFWQVFAEYMPLNGSVPQEEIADDARDRPESFKTAAQTFDAFEKRGLTLQRAVSGDDAGEGAQFGFLKTFNEKTVYTADFALIYNKQITTTQRTGVAFQTSMQGNLTSDESDSEDAFQFRAGVIVDRNLKPNTINHLYFSFAAKYEADQRFRVGKLIDENMVTPTFKSVGIGVPFGRSSDPIQFRWRPYFYFDVGRSFKRGDSSETEDVVLRLTPRVRTVLTLNFLRRALNLNDSFIFADDFFYFLPLEKTKDRHNMLTSGFVLQVTKDFGFGLTYKSGEAAPKFKPVHTLGGVLTIRFGKE
jgi:hypothetical protein